MFRNAIDRGDRSKRHASLFPGMEKLQSRIYMNLLSSLRSEQLFTPSCIFSRRAWPHFLFGRKEHGVVLFKCKENFLMRKLAEERAVEQQRHRNFGRRNTRMKMKIKPSLSRREFSFVYSVLCERGLIYCQGALNVSRFMLFATANALLNSSKAKQHRTLTTELQGRARRYEDP